MAFTKSGPFSGKFSPSDKMDGNEKQNGRVKSIGDFTRCNEDAPAGK
jgi:hypothetical protein